MALFKTGNWISKTIKPILVNPTLIIPSSVKVQTRNAARKGYRVKKLALKKAAAGAAASKATKTQSQRRRVLTEKTNDSEKPDLPEDDIIVQEMFKYKKFSINEAISFHREYHHPSVFNNPSAPVGVKIELELGKKQKQSSTIFSEVMPIPHPFLLTYKKQVLVICKEEDINSAYEAGAALAGSVNIIQRIKEGEIQLVVYDYVVVHVDMMAELTPIRSILKDHMPRAKNGTLTNDLPAAINRFSNGILCNCVRVKAVEDFGFIDCKIGTLDMDTNKLEENFVALMKNIWLKKPTDVKNYFNWVWCYSLHSKEQFSIDLSLYKFETEKEPKREKIKMRQ